jgi:glycosyltransferase involved in cell wall biosynthesis
VAVGRTQPIRVLVDALSARAYGGGGTYVVEQMRALDTHADLELTIVASGGVSDELRGACPRARVLSEPRRSLTRRLLWQQVVLARRARHYDVLYAPGNFGVLVAPIPQVLTHQNIWYFTDEVRRFRRERCPARMRARLAVESAAARLSTRRADVVLAVSASMRDAIARDLPHGGAEVLLSAPPAMPRGDGALPAGLPRDYVLAVATDLPHKDWDGLIAAFSSRAELPPLVLVGDCSKRRRVAVEHRLETLGAQGRVRLAGPVADKHALAAFYRRARCCLAHSYFESFGLTACEALVVDRPLVASDIPAHREVCGGRARYYSPSDPSQMLAAVADAVREGPPDAALAWPLRDRTWADNAAELADRLRVAARGRR